MTDLVVGSEGEVGKPLVSLLKHRNFKVDGYDITKPIGLNPHYSMIHVCIPDSKDFIEKVSYYKKFTDNLVIHSTVKPNTSMQLGAIYSPIRGVHNNMFEHMKTFQKYYAINDLNNPEGSQTQREFEMRFPNSLRKPDSTTLEYTKILVDTSYLGILVWYRKFIDSIHNVYWDFASEYNRRFENRPVLYNDGNSIGGHCVVQNLNLIQGEKMEFLRKLIK